MARGRIGKQFGESSCADGCLLLGNAPKYSWTHPIKCGLVIIPAQA